MSQVRTSRNRGAPKGARRRRARAQGRIAAALDSLPRISAWPATVGGLAFIAVVVAYGLVAGGHVVLPETELRPRLLAASADAGLVIGRITVTGRDKADAGEVMAALGAERGSPILGFDTDAARRRLERLGWVARARVTRLLPDRIHVALTERAPYVLWQRHGRVVVADKTGFVLAGLRVHDHLHLPLVVGEGAGEAAKALYDRLAGYSQIANRLAAAVRVARRRWNLKFEGGLEVRLAENGTAAGLARLKALDDRIQVLSRALVTVDLRLPDRVTFRPSPDATGEDGTPQAGASGGASPAEG